jgi:hypothetical protein
MAVEIAEAAVATVDETAVVVAAMVTATEVVDTKLNCL